MLTKSANATTINQFDVVRFIYNKTNNGNSTLTKPSVTDNSCSPVVPVLFAGFNVGDTNRNDKIDPGEVWQYRCDETFTNAGTFTNTAIGNATDPLGRFITYPSYPTEQANATVTVLPKTQSISSSTGVGSVTFSTSAGGLASLSAVSQSSLNPPPPAGSYPFGFFSFVITGLTPGQTTTLTITYPSPPGNVWEKLIGGTWNKITPTSVIGNVVTLTLTDGAAGQDSDQSVNGQISDPGGILTIIPAKVTGGGHIGKDINGGFVARPSEGGQAKGVLEYQDKTAKINLHSTEITFLSADSSFTHATIQGKAKLNDKTGFTFRVNISDPDKTGNHDTFSITITDSSGKVAYQNSGIVKGHIEIHKVASGEDHHDNNNDNNNDHSDKNSK